jgi:hypothetical protein
MVGVVGTGRKSVRREEGKGGKKRKEGKKRKGEESDGEDMG